MATIRPTAGQIVDPYVSIDLTDILDDLEIECDDEDIEQMLEDDPNKWIAYLIGYYGGCSHTKILPALITALKENLSPPDMIAFIAALSDEKESAA